MPYATFAVATGFGSVLVSRDVGIGSGPNTILGDGGLPINIIAFHWSLFEFINIAWPRSYAVSPDASWWQLWAVPLVLGSMVGLTALHIFPSTIRKPALP